LVPFTHVRWILNLGDPKSLASVVPALPCTHPHTDAHAFRKVKKKKKKKKKKLEIKYFKNRIQF
jgi:hypothetical protein